MVHTILSTIEKKRYILPTKNNSNSNINSNIDASNIVSVEKTLEQCLRLFQIVNATQGADLLCGDENIGIHETPTKVIGTQDELSFFEGQDYDEATGELEKLQ